MRCARGAAQRGLDRLAHHELRAEDLHRLTQRAAHDGLAEPLDEPRQERCRFLGDFGGPHDPAGEQQCPSRRIDEQGVARAEMRLPVGAPSLSAISLSAVAASGDAQQRLREAHEDDAFSGRKVVLAEQRVDACRLRAAAAGSQRRGRARRAARARLAQARARRARAACEPRCSRRRGSERRRRDRAPRARDARRRTASCALDHPSR